MYGYSKTLLLGLFLLSTCSGGTPAYAVVLDAVWDGTCTSIHMSTNVHQRPEDVKTQTGYIPPGFEGDDSDISVCMTPPNEISQYVPPTGGPR